MLEAAIFVGLALLRGAISYVGGQLMASALGGARITDVRTWIAEAVAELEAFVSAELRRQLTELVLNQMRADLEGVIQNVTEYSRLQPANLASNRFLLESCDTRTASLVPLSLNYDQALFISFSAMAYRFFTLFGLYDLDHDQGHIDFARPSVDDFITKTLAAQNRIEKTLNPGTRLVKHIVDRPPRSSSYITLDGNIVWQHNGDDFDNIQVNAAYGRLFAPVQQQYVEFIDKTNAAIILTATCYDDMCRKIGKTYPIPNLEVAVPVIDIVPPLTIRGAAFIMRGAVVVGPIDNPTRSPAGRLP